MIRGTQALKNIVTSDAAVFFSVVQKQDFNITLFFPAPSFNLNAAKSVVGLPLDHRDQVPHRVLKLPDKLSIFRVLIYVHRTQLFGLIVEFGQKRPKPEAPGGRDGLHEAGAGSVKAADLIGCRHGGCLGDALVAKTDEDVF